LLPIRKPTASDFALIVLLGVVWGSTFIAIRVAVVEFGPANTAFLRVVIAGAVLLGYVAVRRIPIPTDWRVWGLVAALSLINIAVPFLLVNWAQLHVNSGVAALIMGFTPLMSLIASHVTTSDDRITPAKLAGMMLGIAGIVTIVGGDALAGLGANILPQLVILAAGACFVAAGAVVRKLPAMANETLAGLIMLFAAIALVPMALAAGWPAMDAISGKGLVALAYVAVVPTAGTNILRLHLIKTVGQSYMSLAGFLIPPVGVLLGTVVLGEPLTATIMIALGLIVAGMVIARLGARGSETGVPPQV